MTGANTQTGFTIIEVILFLAISGIMITTAMISVQGRTRSVQYTDSTRSAESYFQSRYSNVQNGSVFAENEPCSHNGGTYQANSSNPGSCIFLGYLFGANPSAQDTSIELYQIYGKRLTTADTCISGLIDARDTLTCAEPVAVPVNGGAVEVDTFDIPWGLHVTRLENRVGGDTDIQRWGFLRDPVSQEIIDIAFINANDIDNPGSYAQSSGDTFMRGEFGVRMCLTNDYKPSAIEFGLDDSRTGITAVFDDAEREGCPT